MFVQSVTWKRISNTVRESVSYFKQANNASTASTWGKAVATIDAPAALVAGYLLAFNR